MKSVDLTFSNGSATLDNSSGSATDGWIELVITHYGGAGAPTVTLQRSFDGTNFENLQSGEGWVASSQTAGQQRHIFSLDDYPRTVNSITTIGLRLTPYLKINATDSYSSSVISGKFWFADPSGL
jgi:hypothetical protein